MLFGSLYLVALAGSSLALRSGTRCSRSTSGTFNAVSRAFSGGIFKVPPRNRLKPFKGGFMKLYALALGVALSLPAVAQQSTAKTYYDANGRPIGSSTNYGSGTTYYDATGRAVGSSSNYPAVPSGVPQVAPQVVPFYELNINKPENNQPFRLPNAPSLY